METIKEIGESLRAHRKNRQLTLQQAAALIEMDFTALSRIERGTQSVSAETLVRMARAYGVSFGQLLDKVRIDAPAAAVSLKELRVAESGEVIMDPTLRHPFALQDYALAGVGAAALVVRDDAMVPILQPGDIAAVDMDDTKIHTTGGVYAIVIDGQPVARRLFPAPGGVIVQTANSIYPNVHLTGDAVNTLQIIGRVKMARRRSGF